MMPNRNGSIAAGAALLALLAGCATGPEMRRTELSATLTGHQSVPGPGDLDGTGTAIVRVDPGAPRICWRLNVRGIAPATAAHIHRGAAGTAGPPVVTLTTPDAAGHSEGCAGVEADLAREMTGRAHQFYINVHNDAHPAGAIRGQLRGGVTPMRVRRR
jgi:hypothetical protein